MDWDVCPVSPSYRNASGNGVFDSNARADIGDQVTVQRGRLVYQVEVLERGGIGSVWRGRVLRAYALVGAAALTGGHVEEFEWRHVFSVTRAGA